MDYGLSVGKALLREFELRRDGPLEVDECPPHFRWHVEKYLSNSFLFSTRVEEIISKFPYLLEKLLIQMAAVGEQLNCKMTLMTQFFGFNECIFHIF